MAEYLVKNVLVSVEATGVRISASDRDRAEMALNALRMTKRGGRYNAATPEGRAWSDARIALWAAILFIARTDVLVLPAKGYTANPIREAVANGHPHVVVTTDQLADNGAGQTSAAVGMAILRIGEAVGVMARGAKLDDGRWAITVTDR
jgi:hypothetical protein